MATHKLGLRRPEYQSTGPAILTGENEDTGMFVSVYDTTGGNGYVMAVFHEDVGLATWYQTDTLDEARTFVQRLEAVQVAAIAPCEKCGNRAHATWDHDYAPTHRPLHNSEQD